MAKAKSDYWRGSGPEPVEYARLRDPLHGLAKSDLQAEWEQKIVTLYLSWTKHTISSAVLDKRVSEMQASWRALGGSDGLWKVMYTKALRSPQLSKAITRM
jgi:hypothetical protein